jgi:hypothetical protein
MADLLMFGCPRSLRAFVTAARASMGVPFLRGLVMSLIRSISSPVRCMWCFFVFFMAFMTFIDFMDMAARVAAIASESEGKRGELCDGHWSNSCARNMRPPITLDQQTH